MQSILPISLQGHSRNVLDADNLMGLGSSLLLSNLLLHIAKNAMPSLKPIHQVDLLKNAFDATSSTGSDSKKKPQKLQAAPNAIQSTKLIHQAVHSKNAWIAANLMDSDLSDHPNLEFSITSAKCWWTN